MALSANDNSNYKPSGGQHLDYAVAGSTTIYKGALVCWNAAGYLVPADDASGLLWCGIALEEIDNSSGSNGDKDCRVDIGGAIVKVNYEVGTDGSLGDLVYIVDDNTVERSSQTINDIKCGVVVKEDDDNDDDVMWIQLMRPAPALLNGP